MVVTIGSGNRLLPWMQACEAMVTVGSLLEELARREAAVRQRIEQLREQIAGLESRLETEQERLSRLEITRETVEEILGEAAQVVQEPARDAEVVDVVEAVQVRPSVLGVVTVPPWQPGMKAAVLPRAYRDAVETMVDAGQAMRPGRSRWRWGCRMRPPSGRDCGPSSSGWWNAAGRGKRDRDCSRRPNRWPGRWPGRPMGGDGMASPHHRVGDCGGALPSSGSKVPTKSPLDEGRALWRQCPHRLTAPVTENELHPSRIPTSRVELCGGGAVHMFRSVTRTATPYNRVADLPCRFELGRHPAQAGVPHLRWLGNYLRQRPLIHTGPPRCRVWPLRQMPEPIVLRLIPHVGHDDRNPAEVPRQIMISPTHAPGPG